MVPADEGLVEVGEDEQVFGGEARRDGGELRGDLGRVLAVAHFEDGLDAAGGDEVGGEGGAEVGGGDV